MKNLRTIYTDEKLHKKITTNYTKNFKSKRLHVDEVYKEASNAVQNLIRKKRKTNFEEKLNVNTANSKNFEKN